MSDRDDVLAEWLAGGGLDALDVATGGAPDVVGVVSRDLAVLYVNWTAPSLDPKAIIGTDVVALSPPDYRELARSTYDKVLRTGEAAHFEVTFEDHDQLLVWQVRVGPIRIDGEVVGLLTISTDVTEQRRAEADRDRFFALSLDTLMVASPDGRVKRVNPAFGHMLGYSQAELAGKPFIEFIHPDDRANTLGAFDALLNGAPLVDHENRPRGKDGEYRTFSWRAVVDPVTRDIYAVARDVTEHRATELQLRHAQKMEAVGQLAGGVAHDFNNLTQAILANAELATLLTTNDSELVAHLSAISQAAERAGALTRQLLAFSRSQPLKRAPLSLNDLVQSLCTLMRRLVPENIAIELVPAAELAPVNGDATQLEQVLLNLLVNARDAMARGGRLNIRTENVVLGEQASQVQAWARPGPYVLLTVADTGVGMTPAVRERVFEPFFSTKGTHGGTGLGLATAYGIVRQHDGMLEVESAPGEGTTFKVYLPAGTKAPPRAEPPTESTPGGGSETILVAEDEALVRQAVIEILRQNGYNPLEASNGVEAVERLRSHPGPVHLALLDIIMPGLDGPETCERLRMMQPDLRVLFVSGYADGTHRERLPAGAQVLTKPLRMRPLLRRIRETLDT